MPASNANRVAAVAPTLRRALRISLLACAAVPLLAAAAGAPKVTTRSPVPIHTGIYDPRIDARVEKLLRRMTLEEKVGQLVQYSAGQPTGPGTGRSDYDDMLAKGQIGALFNISTARETNAYQRIAVEKSRLRIPVVFGLDVIHGFRTEFPIPLGLAASWDPPLVEATARVAASEATATGIRWTFSPMVDIARDARWGRISEGAGEDPFLGSVLAAAYVRGYQGTRLDAPDSMAACAKHYVGYGAAEGGRDYNSTEISEHTLRQVYLPPFHAAVDAGAATIMSAFNALNGMPASANAFTLTQVLRREWGFRGVVDSDWTSIAELVAHGIANDGATAARKALLAGVDMDMASSLYHDHLADLVRSGQVPVARLDEAVRRVLRLKFALGLFDHPYVDEAREGDAMLRPDSVALARTAAERSLVLLKNDPVGGGAPLLPLSPDVHDIALIGPLADDAANMLGSWAGLGRPADAVTLRTALVDRIGTAHVLHETGVPILGGSDEGIAAAVSAASRADLVVLALGEDAPTMTGEAASRSVLGLPGRQQELLERVAATGKPLVLILFSGRPLTLPWAFEHVPAVLAAWFPGIQAGPALVRTLFGDVNPSGHLPLSWPRAVGQEPLYYNALNTGRPAGAVDLSRPAQGGGDEKYVSRYIDQQNSPQFPFGYGLSYTSFRYGPTHLEGGALHASTLNEALRSGNKSTVLTVSAEVTNIGSRAGATIAQLYVGLRGTSIAMPVRALAGFQRIELAPGQTKTVRFELDPAAFALWDEQQRHQVEPAQARVWVAADSAAGSPVTVTIAP